MIRPALNKNVCLRCKGKRYIAADEDHDMILSCPDCEGTWENFYELDRQDDADFGHAMGLDLGD